MRLNGTVRVEMPEPSKHPCSPHITAKSEAQEEADASYREPQLAPWHLFPSVEKDQGKSESQSNYCTQAPQYQCGHPV